MRYVTYDPKTGLLTGAYIQDLQDSDSSAYIEILDDDIYRNWTAYQANAARDGLELAPVSTPSAPVPTEVSMESLSLALLAAGHWGAIKSYFAGLPDDAPGERDRIRFTRAVTARRDCDLVIAVAAAVSITSIEIDALFVAADAIK